MDVSERPSKPSWPIRSTLPVQGQRYDPGESVGFGME